MSLRAPTQLSPPGSYSEPFNYAINSRTMLTTIIIILFIVVLIILSLHLYSRWYLFHSRRSHLRRSRRAWLLFFSNPSSTALTTNLGLNSSIINSLPIFTFSSNANAIECAVCLSAFEENESCRVLPNCKHTFHVHCIGLWLRSHSTCPLCRAPVFPIAAEEVAFSISRPELDRNKPEAIETPIGESEENELTQSQSFRSPMSRVRSFTRILSRDRRIGVPPVVSPPVTELDMEMGGREETR